MIFIDRHRKIGYNNIRYAGLAHLVERLLPKQKVAGSSPVSRSTAYALQLPVCSCGAFLFRFTEFFLFMRPRQTVGAPGRMPGFSGLFFCRFKSNTNFFNCKDGSPLPIYTARGKCYNLFTTLSRFVRLFSCIMN